ncbi:MAG: hypothetical protein MUE53_04280 [Chitinophagales bacterium]|jgi:hypothetical protein|nr:hypothetical protein [Chitinophagales bacterium]
METRQRIYINLDDINPIIDYSEEINKTETFSVDQPHKTLIDHIAQAPESKKTSPYELCSKFIDKTQVLGNQAFFVNTFKMLEDAIGHIAHQCQAKQGVIVHENLYNALGRIDWNFDIVRNPLEADLSIAKTSHILMDQGSILIDKTYNRLRTFDRFTQNQILIAHVKDIYPSIYECIEEHKNFYSAETPFMIQYEQELTYQEILGIKILNAQGTKKLHIIFTDFDIYS